MQSGNLAPVPEVERVPPPYVQIADHYAAEIDAGRLKPGERIPSTATIVREWNVSTATASKAMTRLATLGYVEGRVGIGTVVLPPERRQHDDGPPPQEG